MSMTYSRFVAASADDTAIAATEAHVRAHLSSVADAGDNPGTHADAVRVLVRPVDNGVLVVGSLDANPTAPYLAEGYDPYDGVPDELRAEATR